MKLDISDHKLALTVDLLAPEEYDEIAGGGQPADRLDLWENGYSITDWIRYH